VSGESCSSGPSAAAKVAITGWRTSPREECAASVGCPGLRGCVYRSGRLRPGNTTATNALHNPGCNRGKPRGRRTLEAGGHRCRHDLYGTMPPHDRNAAMTRIPITDRTLYEIFQRKPSAENQDSRSRAADAARPCTSWSMRSPQPTTVTLPVILRRSPVAPLELRRDRTPQANPMYQRSSDGLAA
jgi:hypothetical protein